LAAGVALVWLALSASLGIAADTAESVRPTLDKLLKAIEANDYAAFVADATEAVKTKLTKPMLEEVSAQYAPRMKKGFECTFLGELKQQGCQVTLWKLAFKDVGDDTLAKLVMKDGKVAGFWLQ
jgi:hypothetical protein